MTRRTLLLVGAASVYAARPTAASTLSIARELRRMVGFTIIAADTVRQSWRTPDTNARFIELRESGLFKEVGRSGLLNPPGFTDVVVFAKAMDPALRRQYPGLSTRAYYDYRLLIDGEVYHVVAFD